MTRYRWALSGAALWASTIAAQITLDAVPGGVVEIPLVPAEQPAPEAYFGQQRLLVMEFGPRWVGVVGLPLDLVPGMYVVLARTEDSEEDVTREFTVHPRRIRGQSLIELPDIPLELPGIEFEWRETLDARFPLDAPVAAPAQPSFGRYRQISDSESAYVNFVSFRIDSDAPVIAPGRGRVTAVQATDSGTFVWLDHGMGLFTCIGPINRVIVNQSDSVEAGEHLGRILLNNFDEPVLLYWSVFLNGTAVNPFLVSELVEDTSG